MSQLEIGLTELERRIRTQDWYHDFSEQENCDEIHRLVDGRPPPRRAAPRRRTVAQTLFHVGDLEQSFTQLRNIVQNNGLDQGAIHQRLTQFLTEYAHGPETIWVSVHFKDLAEIARHGTKWCDPSPRDLHSHALIETLNCDNQPKQMLHRCCLPGCGHDTSATRDIETCFLYRLDPLHIPDTFRGGGGGRLPF